MASPERQIENLTKRVETLARIITANSLNYICPQCFCGFSEQRLLYRHFDKEKQNCPTPKIYPQTPAVSRLTSWSNTSESIHDGLGTFPGLRLFPRQ
ncbi:hypothetical protein KXW63_000786, partial [Aspergillus fumigatus]